MNNQQPRSGYPAYDHDETWPMESRAEIDYVDNLESSDEQSWWHQNAPTSSSFGEEQAHCCDMLDEIPLLDDIILMEKGQSSGSKGSHDSGFLEMQAKGEEDVVKEDSDTNDQSKQQKRIRCPEVHNQNERVRRQKLKEKMKALQEIIPNCNKRDKLSTLDDAIKHIKTLQYQVQMMSTGGGYSAFPSPLMMQQQGVGMPYNTFPPTGHPQGGSFGGMEYQIGMEMTGMSLAMNQVGLPNPYLPPSPSRLPASGGAHSFKRPSLPSSSSMDQAPFLQGAVNPVNDTQFPTSGHLH